MTRKNKAENAKYFAAANTYAGFKSYFADIFSPYNFEKIYVIKGGPGTGKSSLMKRLAFELGTGECSVDEIYCSSDPNSLDGIIVKANDKQIAVIDGTAPHETDAKIPGAVDEIINLGENWDKRWLEAKREDIKELCKEKSAAYSTAYSYLKIAGEAFNFVMNSAYQCFNSRKARDKAEELCREINIDNSKKRETKLLSSFGKNGKQHLVPQGIILKKTYSVVGDECSALLFLNEIKKELDRLDASYIFFPAALSPSYLDAIYLPSDSTAFFIGGNENQINSEDFLLPSYNLCAEKTKQARNINEMALCEAARWFNIASDFHFRLEEIYSQSMSFEKNDAIFSKILDEIKNIVSV